MLYAFGLLVVAIIAKWTFEWPRRAVAAFALLALVFTNFSWLSTSLFRGRSYFGAYRVMVGHEESAVTLVHGQINHGYQNWRDGEALVEPTSYYHRGSGVGLAFSEIADRPGEKRVAVVGLGTGIVAAYVTDDMEIDFYEIDPLIVEIAHRFFTFLKACGERCKTIVGDARIELRNAEDGSYDLIVEDAFNSDSVPVHLLTREAMGLYLDKLSPDGLIAFHLSNRYLDLPPVVAALARDFSLELRIHTPPGEAGPVWLILGRDAEAFGGLDDAPGVRPWRGRDVEPWTDDFADVVSAFRL